MAMRRFLDLIGSRAWRRLDRSALLAIALLGAAGCSSAGFQRAGVVITVKPPAGLVRRADGVRVHLDTGDPLRLEVLDGQSWESACNPPCDKALAAGKTYRLTRQDRPVSDEFKLDVPSGSQVTIAVEPTESIDTRPSTTWLKPTL